MRKYGKVIAMTGVALGMTAMLTLESAMAYFTTYVSAEGGHIVNLGANTSIEEEVSDKTKHVTITNTSDYECVVRVKVLSGRQVIFTPSGDNWIDGGDGFWYYSEVLKPEEPYNKTDVLDVTIDITGLDKDAENFNVVVLQECAPAIYDADGNPAIFDKDGNPNPECWDVTYTNWQEYKDIAGGEGDDN